LVNGHWATLLGAWLVAMTRYGVDTWRVALFVSTYNWRTHPGAAKLLTRSPDKAILSSRAG